MIREIITPKHRYMTIRIPQRMVGKPLELTIVEQGSDSVKTPESAEQEQAKRLKRIEALVAPLKTDLSKFTFNRDEANDYER